MNYYFAFLPNFKLFYERSVNYVYNLIYIYILYLSVIFVILDSERSTKAIGFTFIVFYFVMYTLFRVGIELEI